MDNEIFYGVWIPGQGWLKGKEVFADKNLAKARQVARMVGRGACVKFIDAAIVDIQHLYLEQEQRSLWHTFRNLFKPKTSK